MHKAQSHLHIQPMKSRADKDLPNKPFSPPHAAATGGLKQGSIPNILSQSNHATMTLQAPNTAASAANASQVAKPSSKKSLGNGQPALKNSGHLRKMAANAVASQLHNSSAFANVASVIESYGTTSHGTAKYKSRRRRAVPAPQGSAQTLGSDAAHKTVRDASD